VSRNAKLFIDLYLDEDVDILVAELLRARGFLVETTRDAGNLGRSDQAQLDYAMVQQKAFFTHNRADFEGFANAYFATGKPHGGIIIGVRHRPHELVRRLLLILNQTTSDETANQLIYI